MAEREGSEKKTQRRRRRAVRRPPRQEAGTSGTGEPGKPGPNGDWAEIADRAARKLSDLADKARPAAEKAGETAKKVAVDLSEGLESAFAKISAQARDLMAKGQHTRVRVKFRGKQITEIPIAVVAAAEVASFWWFGPLRVVLGHVVGRAVLDVEFVSNADHHVAVAAQFGGRKSFGPTTVVSGVGVVQPLVGTGQYCVSAEQKVIASRTVPVVVTMSRTEPMRSVKYHCMSALAAMRAKS